MRRLKTILLFLLSLLFGGVVFVYVGNTIGWEAVLDSFKIFYTVQGLYIVVLSFLIAFLGGLRWKEILKDEGVKISLFKACKIYTAGFSILYLFPMIVFGSELFRASALERREKIGMDKALASVIIERILEWTINVLVILFGTLYFFFAVAKPSENLFIIILASFVFVLAIISFVYFYIFRKKSFVSKIVLKFNNGNYKENVLVRAEKILFDYFNIKNLNLWKGYLLSIIKILVMLFRVWLIIFFLGSILNFSESLSVLGFSFLSTLIPVPATFGVHELIQAFAFENLDIGLKISTAFTMALRAGDVIVSVLGFVLFFKVGYGFLRNKFLKDEKR